MTMGMSDRDNNIGGRLRHARLEAGYTAARAGERIGVTRNTVEVWERNQNIPSGFNLIVICQIYGVSADWILFGTGSMINPDRKYEQEIIHGEPA
jgi:transcriptional regulator with XRE-family HTH domain